MCNIRYALTLGLSVALEEPRTSTEYRVSYSVCGKKSRDQTCTSQNLLCRGWFFGPCFEGRLRPGGLSL